MKRFHLYSLVLLATLVASPAAADFKPLVEVGTSILWGRNDEFVLHDSSYKDPTSRLKWDVPPSTAIALTGLLPWTDWTSTRLSLKGSVPWIVGIMIDEDWNADDLKYGRSEHQAFLKSNWSAMVEETATVEWFTFLLGAEYRWVNWEGWNGTGHYEYTNGSTRDYNYGGLVIAYRQQWILPYAGLSATGNTPFGNLSATVRYGPYTWCNDMDNHNYASSATSTFLDYMVGGEYLQGGVEIVWPQTGWSWGLRGEGAMTWGAMGISFETTTQQTTAEVNTEYSGAENGGGAQFFEFAFTVFVRN